MPLVLPRKFAKAWQVVEAPAKPWQITRNMQNNICQCHWELREKESIFLFFSGWFPERSLIEEVHHVCGVAACPPVSVHLFAPHALDPQPWLPWLAPISLRIVMRGSGWVLLSYVTVIHTSGPCIRTRWVCGTAFLFPVVPVCFQQRQCYESNSGHIHHQQLCVCYHV